MFTSKLALVSMFALSGVAFAGSEGNVIATCNDGALEVVRDGDNYSVLVNNAGVAEFFVSESKSSHTTTADGSPYGLPGSYSVTVTKTFPWMVQANDDGKQLKIVDFRRYDGNRFSTSGPAGATLESVGNGLRLSLIGGNMPGSHSVIYYPIGNWFFESCSFIPE